MAKDSYIWNDIDSEAFAGLLQDYGAHINHWAQEKGWWENPNRNFGELLALMHSEISEALEEYRNNPSVTHVYYRASDGKPEGVGVELADCIIRILDTAHAYNIPIGQLLIEKLRFNETRPYRHGGKNA